jgi:hypothetical protein
LKEQFPILHKTRKISFTKIELDMPFRANIAVCCGNITKNNILSEQNGFFYVQTVGIHSYHYDLSGCESNTGTVDVGGLYVLIA